MQLLTWAILLIPPLTDDGKINNTIKDTTATTKTWDVTINEIMADPDPPAGSIIFPEYVELYNKTDHSIKIKNWKFCVGTNCKPLPDISVPADSFLVLTTPSGSTLFPAEVNTVGISGFPALTNTGQTLQLQNEQGNSISVISYADDWYRDEAKQEGGYSLEQIDVLNPCAEKQNWKASNSASGGTPGKRNTVAAAQPDKNPPEILHVNVLSPEQLEVIFTESMDSTTLMNLTGYEISSIGNPVSIRLSKPTYKSITLYLGTLLNESVLYTLTVKSNITDCAGNVIDQNRSARFAIPVEAEAGDVVINELLTDPRSGGVDFVEIYNRSGKVVDLKALFLCHYDTVTKTLSGIAKIINSGYLLFPAEYLVLTESADAVKNQYITAASGAFLNVKELPSLDPDAGSICLKTAATIIDHFTYNSAMHFALLKDTKGISLERVNFSRPTNSVTNWHSASSSVGFATPGFKNSQFLNLISSEESLKVDPETFSPNGDGWNDQVTIYYQFDQPGYSATIQIFDSSGRLVKTLVNNELMSSDGVYSWDGINDERKKERTGIYIIYMNAIHLSGMIKQYKKVCVLSGKE